MIHVDSHCFSVKSKAQHKTGIPMFFCSGRTTYHYLHGFSACLRVKLHLQAFTHSLAIWHGSIENNHTGKSCQTHGALPGHFDDFALAYVLILTSCRCWEQAFSRSTNHNKPALTMMDLPNLTCIGQAKHCIVTQPSWTMFFVVVVFLSWWPVRIFLNMASNQPHMVAVGHWHLMSVIKHW